MVKFTEFRQYTSHPDHVHRQTTSECIFRYASISVLAAIISLYSISNCFADRPPSAAKTSVQVVDGQSAGLFNSLGLRKDDTPIISYWDKGAEVIKLAICKDKSCSNRDFKAFGVNTGIWPTISASTSLKLNSQDIPFFSYISSRPYVGDDPVKQDIVLATCSTLGCDAFSYRTVARQWETMVTSLDLDNAGNPVIIASDALNEEFALVVCSDPFCNTSLVTTGSSSRLIYPSLALDSNNHPIIAGSTFYGNDRYWLTTCTDDTCTSKTSQELDSGVEVIGSSLLLDNKDLPRISYLETVSNELVLATCANSDCSSINKSVLDDRIKTTFTSSDSAGIPANTSMAIDRNGFSVISYYSASHNLRVAACNDNNCTNPTLTTVKSELLSSDVAGYGRHSSLAIDSVGVPVISYSDEWSIFTNLNLSQCPMCRVPARNSLGPGYTGMMQLTADDIPVTSYWDLSDGGALHIVVCEDELCVQSNDYTVDDSGAIGANPSMVLNGNGFPTISYWDHGKNDLKLAICNDSVCSGPILKTIDGDSSSVGSNSSVKINAGGFAVISYYDSTNKDLKLAVCNNASCSNPTIKIVDGTNSDVGAFNSMVLNASGFPVISYQDTTNKNLKLAICQDALCETKTIRVIDSSDDVGEFTSIALTSSGNAVISYYDKTNKDLKMSVCNNLSCTSNTKRVIDGFEVDSFMGKESSLALTEDDYAIISYIDESIGAHDVRVAVCSDVLCETPTLTTVDQEGLIGDSSSLALRKDGFPAVMYKVGGSLKIAVYRQPTGKVFADGFE